MEDSSVRSVGNEDLPQNKELYYSNNQFNFKNVLSISLILDLICQFIEVDDMKYLCLCSKKMYEFYCNLIKSLKTIEIKERYEIIYLSKINCGKYINLIELNLRGSQYIKDFSSISKLEKLENLNLSNTNVSDISFLEKNKNIKELNLERCKNIQDYSLYQN